MTPTATSIKLRFPEFSDIPDMTVEFAIEEASRHVDDTWLPEDKPLALSYLAAHYIMVAKSRQESDSGQMISAETIGRISIRYATPEQPKAASPSDLTTTPYGARYLELATLNNPPIATV